MRKKTIGLFLTVHPSAGGTYQYCLSIIKALEMMSNDYKLIAFVADKRWSTLIPPVFDHVYKSRPFICKVLERLWREVDRSEARYKRAANLFNPIVKAMNQSDCDLIIFPGQDAFSSRTRKKSLSSIHDLMHRYESRFKEYKHGAYERREIIFSDMCQQSCGILVDSNVGKIQVIESYNVDVNKIFVLPFVPPFYLLNGNIVDVNKKYSLPEKYIFYPAQFWEHKNHISLLRALKIVVDEGLDVNLVLSGSKKNNYNSVLREIERLHLDDKVFIIGYVTNDEIYSLYKKAIALTFVSLIGPTNIPPLEAMILGCPVIVSNIYAMPEQVKDAALLVEPEDPSDIAEKIYKIWTDKLLQGDLSSKGKKVVAAYGQSEFNSRLNNIITTLLNSKYHV